MKFTKKYISITAVVSVLTILSSCAERYLAEIPYPEDITFNELSLDRFSYEIPDAPFEVGNNASGIITVNVAKSSDGSYSGFALSNRNFRSYPWELSALEDDDNDDLVTDVLDNLTDDEIQAAINSTAFSVFTDDVNRTENYLVGNTAGDNAYFSLSTPSTISHILVANTTYNALLANYGSIYSGTLDEDTQKYSILAGTAFNLNIDGPDGLGIFALPGIDGTLETLRLQGVEYFEKEVVRADKTAELGGDAGAEAIGNAAVEQYKIDTPSRANNSYYLNLAYNNGIEVGFTDVIQAAVDAYGNGYVTLHIEGFLNGTSVGNVDVYLSVLENTDLENPDYSFTVSDWRKVDLTSLGEVDKVLFNMSSSYVNTDGTMVYPSTFCLDGIRLQ